VEGAVALERAGADLQDLPGVLRADQEADQRTARDHAVLGGRGDGRLRDAGCRQRGSAAGAVLVAGLLDRQGAGARRHQRLRLRLPAPVAAGRLVPLQGRAPDAGGGLQQVQHARHRAVLVGRRVHPLEEADPQHGRLQGRQVPLAPGHDRGDPRQARRFRRGAARRRGVLGARQGRGGRRRLGQHLHEPAHGLSRGRQVPHLPGLPLDAGAGLRRQHERVESPARRRQGHPRKLGPRVDLGPGRARDRGRYPGGRRVEAEGRRHHGVVERGRSCGRFAPSPRRPGTTGPRRARSPSARSTPRRPGFGSSASSRSRRAAAHVRAEGAHSAPSACSARRPWTASSARWTA